MKKIVLLLSCLLLGAIAPANAGLLCVIGQSTQITGSVINENTKEAVAWVMVSTSNGKNAYTDAEGKFSIMEPGNIPATITFTCIGFEKRTIDLSTYNPVGNVIELGKIDLKESALQIPEIAIVSHSLTRTKNITTLSTISKRDLERTQPSGSEEMLKKVAGVNVAGDMGISNRLNIGIRGSYPRRSEKILVLEDGRPIAPAPYLAPEMYYNPPTDRLDGIEIIKGADILTYGSNTMYGVVNYITKLPPVKPTLGVNITGGENGYASNYITYGGTWNNLGAEIQMLNKHFDGFQKNSGSDIFNTTFKVYSELTKKQTIYFKANYHQENSKASYSALTPLTFKLNPKENPFDADDLATKRFAADFGYNLQVSNNFILSTKAYAFQFQRDWWRQENTLIKASTAKTYLGEEIYNERYSYLDGQTFGNDDWIRVGKVVKGKESTRARNRKFNVAGIEEIAKYTWKRNQLRGKLEAGLKHHVEEFYDIEISNDSSRFARSGKLAKDNKFILNASSAYVKNSFTYNRITIAPSVRYELIEMKRFDMLKISQNPANNGTKNFGSNENTFETLLAGAALSYDLIEKENNTVNLYGGVYQGYTPPTSGYAFLSVDNGVVNASPKEEDPINILPEKSINYEIGVRSQLLKQLIVGQATWFNNNIRNFYSAGRSEAFQTLGNVSIKGAEIALSLNLHQFVSMNKHEFSINSSVTYMQSKILSGVIVDSDLLKAKHTDASKQEIIDKINGSRGGYNIYVSNSAGKDSLITRNLSTDDFSSIKKLEMVFGKDGIQNNSAPYIPKALLNIGFIYGYKGFTVGSSINWVDKQYVDYINLNNETAEGAMGVIPAYKSIDANVSYSFTNYQTKWLKGLTLFVAGKNITNEVYLGSRLHRVSSGMMPAGFRQINGGIRWNF